MEGNASFKLKQFVSRIEKLEEEKQDIADCIKEVFAEAVSAGFDRKALREIIKRRKVEPDELSEFDFLVEEYINAIGK